MALSGKAVCFTGTLSMKRADAANIARDHGATVKTGVSKACDIVVHGPGAGSKLEKAIALGIEIWTEEQFVQATSSSSQPPPPTPEKKNKQSKKAAPTPEKVKASAKTSKKKATSAPISSAPPKAKKAKQSPRERHPDRLIPNNQAYNIYEDYTIKLMQTNIEGNNNKFYIIQVLEKGGKYFLWTRWGRLGENGQNALQPQPNEAAAIKAFEKKFKDKSKNNWAERANFVKHANKYQIVDTEEQDGDGDGAGGDQCLGKLSESQIKLGQGVLQELEEELMARGDRNVLNTLSSQFFSLIPTNFGRQRPVPITDMDALREKEELLKFYLRMGFQDMSDDASLTPIDGVMDTPLPPTLMDAAKFLCDAFEITNCLSTGASLSSKQAGNPVKKMSKELYACILLYTSNAIYSDINRSLRNKNRAAIKKYMKYLRMFFEAKDHLPQASVTLWRGISVDLYDQYAIGNTITWWSISSCTADEKVARNFMQGCGGKCTLVKVRCKTAMDISNITFYSNEKESLLAPGTQLVVKKRKRVGNVAEIEMEEIGHVVG